MIIIKNNDDLVHCDLIFNLIEKEDCNKDRYFSLACKVKNSKGYKVIQYCNNLTLSELRKRLEEYEIANSDDKKFSNLIKNKFLIVSKPHLNEIRMRNMSNVNSNTGETYVGVICYDGIFKIPGEPFINSYYAFADFVKERKVKELTAFVKIKELRINYPEEPYYWDFLVDDDDENLAMVCYDSINSDIIRLSDNFIKDSRYPSLNYFVKKNSESKKSEHENDHEADKEYQMSLYE